MLAFTAFCTKPGAWIVPSVVVFGLVVSRHRPARLFIPEPAPALNSSAPAVRVSASPTPLNVCVNDPTGEPVGHVQSEAVVAAHGDTLVAVWNDAVGYFESASMCGFGVSLDGGITWSDGGELPEPATREISGDPSMVGHDGWFVSASVDLGWDDGIAIHRGRVVDGALQWETPSLYVQSGGEALDKPFLSLDPETGRMYLAYVNWSQNRGEVSWSDDLGITWAEPLTVYESSVATGYQPVAGVGGVLDVVWTDRIGQPNGRIHSRRAIDGTWIDDGAVVSVLGPRSHEPPAGYNRTVNATFAAGATDASFGPHRGRTYVAWTDGHPGAFSSWVSWTDTGIGWSEPLRLSESTNAFWPAIDVGFDGRVTALWFDRRHAETGVNDLTDVYARQSLDGGVSFADEHRLSDRSVSWTGIPADLVPNFGDYLGVDAAGSDVVATWSDGRHGDPDVVACRWTDRVAVDADVNNIAYSGVNWRLGNRITWTGVDDGIVTPALSLAVGAIGLPADAVGLEHAFTGGDHEITLQFSHAGEALTLSVEIDPGDPFHRETITATGVTVGALSTVPDSKWHGELFFSSISSTEVSVTGFLDLSSADPLAPNTVRVGVTGSFHSSVAGDLPARLRLEQAGARAGGDVIVSTRIEAEAGPVSTPIHLLHELPTTARVQLSPNPIRPAGTGAVRVTAGAEARVRVRVFDIAGRLVRDWGSVSLGAGESSVPVAAVDSRDAPLAPGTYLVRVEGGGVRAAERLVVVP